MSSKKIKKSLSEIIFWKNFDHNWSCFLATCFIIFFGGVYLFLDWKNLILLTFVFFEVDSVLFFFFFNLVILDLIILDQFYQFCSIIIGLLCFWGLLPPICHRGEGSHQFLRPRVAGATDKLTPIYPPNRVLGGIIIKLIRFLASKIDQIALNVTKCATFKIMFLCCGSMTVLDFCGICQRLYRLVSAILS